MSEEQEVICEQCKNVPTQFVILDCEHKFCLFCISQAFHKDDSGVPCLKCNAPTILDQESLQALCLAKEQFSQPQNQNFQVKPFTTDKKQHIQPIKEDLTVKGHPCIEKLNVATERSLDRIRNIQFEKQQIKEKCQNYKIDINQEFKQLHLYIDSKQEDFLNQLSNIEIIYLNKLISEEEQQQLDLEEISVVKNEIKSILKNQDEDYEEFTFKQLLVTVDNIVSEKQLTINKLSFFKELQEELQKLNKKQNQFYEDFRKFFNIIQPLQFSLTQNYISPNKIQPTQISITSDIQDKIQELKNRNSRSINNTQLNISRNQNSPPKNTFLNEEINLARKIEREGFNLYSKRKLNSSPMNTNQVLQSSIQKKTRSNSKFAQIINSPFALGGFSYLT